MIGKILQVGLALGLTAAGLQSAGVPVKEFLQSPIDRGSEWMTLCQIGRGLMVEAQLYGRSPHQVELETFLRVNMDTPGRDSTRDIWSTAYRLETGQWNGLILPPDGLHFVVSSAGPNRLHGDADDLHWLSFTDESAGPAFNSFTSVGREAVETVAGWIDTARSTGGEAMGKMGDALGLTEKPRSR